MATSSPAPVASNNCFPVIPFAVTVMDIALTRTGSTKLSSWIMGSSRLYADTYSVNSFPYASRWFLIIPLTVSLRNGSIISTTNS